MSIYRDSRHGRSADQQLAWGKVLQKETGAGADQQADPAAIELTETEWARLRKAVPLDRLLPTSIKWLTGLPIELAPLELAARYPRVTNLLVQHWDDSSACSAYFNELLYPRRPGRRGFPASVRRDLLRLHDYFVLSQLPKKPLT